MRDQRLAGVKHGVRQVIMDTQRRSIERCLENRAFALPSLVAMPRMSRGPSGHEYPHSHQHDGR